TPIVQCSGCTSATTVGPALHLPVPSTLGVAVGIKKAGPTPQISFPGFAGDMKKLILRSPRPVLEPSGLVTSNERSEEHTSELQSRFDLVCRLLLEKKKKQN